MKYLLVVLFLNLHSGDFSMEHKVVNSLAECRAYQKAFKKAIRDYPGLRVESSCWATEESNDE